MKTLKFVVLLTMALAGPSADAQAFRNLNFEAANPIVIVGDSDYPYAVTAASALPFWTVYLGSVQQTEVQQNAFNTGEAVVDIFGPNYPAANLATIFPGTIDGRFSVLLQQGGNPDQSGELVNASIAQTGLVPTGSRSLQFKAWTFPFTQFSVTFDGNSLIPVVLGSSAGYLLYGVDISSYAGEVGTLEFSALQSPGASWLGLDDITFSTQVVPEPTPMILTGIAGLLFAIRHCRLFPRESQ